MSLMVLSALAFFTTGLVFVILMYKRGAEQGDQSAKARRKRRRQDPGSHTARAVLLGSFAFAMLIVLGDTMWDLYIVYLQTQDVAKIQQMYKEQIKSGIRTVVRKVVKDKYLTNDNNRNNNNKTRRGRGRSNQRTQRPEPQRKLIAARSAPGRKYELLGYMCALAMLLFVFTRPHLWNFVTRLFSFVLLSWRGVNPWVEEEKEEPEKQPETAKEEPVEVKMPPPEDD